MNWMMCFGGGTRSSVQLLKRRCQSRRWRDPRVRGALVKSLLDRAVALLNETPPSTREDADAILGATGYILIQAMLRLKHPQFFEEDEWRVLLITWVQEHRSLLRYRTRNGQQVPYIEWTFRREYLDEVIIGPGPFSMDEAELREVFAAYGIGNTAVSHSRIPLR